MEDAVKRKLLTAATHGRIGELRKLLVAQPGLIDTMHNHRSTEMTLLAAACAEGQHGAIETLVGLGASLNRPALDGRTPLMLAASHADVELVRLLLGYSADPLRTDVLGRNATDHAFLMGSQRPNDPTWTRCVTECADMLNEARVQRLCLAARRRWRRAIWIVLLLRAWQDRAAERAYMPGGIGFVAAQVEFLENANLAAALAREHAGQVGDQGRAAIELGGSSHALRPVAAYDLNY
jgi:hypothetical protein